MTNKELESKVIKWAKDKGILDLATPHSQIDKTIEEVNETKLAILAQKYSLKEYLNKDGEKRNTKAEILDGFGDILVTVIIGLEMQGLTMNQALNTAYNVISKRNGKMINGQFVKDK